MMHPPPRTYRSMTRDYLFMSFFASYNSMMTCDVEVEHENLLL